MQTVNEDQNPVLAELLTEYMKRSGIGLLGCACARGDGGSPFTSVASAMEWGKVNYIWSDFMLYERAVKSTFDCGEHRPQACTP